MRYQTREQEFEDFVYDAVQTKGLAVPPHMIVKFEVVEALPKSNALAGCLSAWGTSGKPIMFHIMLRRDVLSREREYVQRVLLHELAHAETNYLYGPHEEDNHVFETICRSIGGILRDEA